MSLDQMMDSLTKQFDGIEIKKSAFHTFVKEKCRISCKKCCEDAYIINQKTVKYSLKH
jgi:hypothetical protein